MYQESRIQTAYEIKITFHFSTHLHRKKAQRWEDWYNPRSWSLKITRKLYEIVCFKNTLECKLQLTAEIEEASQKYGKIWQNFIFFFLVTKLPGLSSWDAPFLSLPSAAWFWLVFAHRISMFWGTFGGRRYVAIAQTTITAFIFLKRKKASDHA